MSIHSSLRSAGGAGGAHRNVFKRHERVKILQQQGRWKPGDSVYGIAKVKSIKIKVKKEAKAAPAAAGAPGAAPAAAAAEPAKKAAEAKKPAK